MKGVSRFMKAEEIQETLENQNYKILHVERMTKRYPRMTERTPLPLTKLVLSENEESIQIYKVDNILQFRVTVEPKHSNTGPQQCTRCQQFGQGAEGCKMTPRCHSCAEDHHYTQFKKPTSTPQKAATDGNNIQQISEDALNIQKPRQRSPNKQANPHYQSFIH